MERRTHKKDTLESFLKTKKNFSEENRLFARLENFKEEMKQDTFNEYLCLRKRN